MLSSCFPKDFHWGSNNFVNLTKYYIESNLLVEVKTVVMFEKYLTIVFRQPNGIISSISINKSEVIIQFNYGGVEAILNLVLRYIQKGFSLSKKGNKKLLLL